MIRKFYLPIVIFAAMTAFTTGCASTKQYAGFAQAGVAYSTALDRLLVAAGNTAIDATSERLLQDDKLSNRSADDYKKLSRIDEERLAVITRLRAHARLLSRYFGTLNELATSDVPERAQQEIGGTVDSLNQLGNQLRGSNLVTNKDAVTSLSELAVAFTLRSQLKDELGRRKDIIRVELQTQEVLLKALRTAIQHDLNIINQTQEQRLVIEPLIAPAPIANPDEWVAHRRAVLTSQAQIAEIETASDAARQLREAFDALIADKLDMARVNTLLTDIESIMAVANTINR